MSITVMITTRNRCHDLRRTLDMISQLQPEADEILITADGCQDETAEMVRAEFNHCTLIINEVAMGSIYSRDNMIRVANGEIVLSLDDDSYPLDSNFLEKLKECFDSHPEASVLAFPELSDSGEFVSESKSPNTPGHYVSAYANGAAAMRKRDYLATGGFPVFFFHAYEEPDYALQVYALGRTVWFEPSMVIRHHYSTTNRNELKTHHLNARNELWSVWMRCPAIWILPVSLFRIFRQFCYACSGGLNWVIQEPSWWLAALKGAAKCWMSRSPIRWKTYFAWMKLARSPIFNHNQLQIAFKEVEAF